MEEYKEGTTTGVIKGDTRSLDNGSYECLEARGLRSVCHTRLHLKPLNPTVRAFFRGPSK